MREPTVRRQRRGWAATSGPRRAFAGLIALGVVLGGQTALSSAAVADTVSSTASPSATATSLGDTSPTSSATTPTTTSSATTGSPTSATSSPSSSTPPPPPPGDGEHALTPGEVAAQVAQARALRGALVESDAKLAALGQKLAEAAVKATAALEHARQAELGRDVGGNAHHDPRWSSRSEARRGRLSSRVQPRRRSLPVLPCNAHNCAPTVSQCRSIGGEGDGIRIRIIRIIISNGDKVKRGGPNLRESGGEQGDLPLFFCPTTTTEEAENSADRRVAR